MSTAAQIEIVGNEIFNFHSSGFIFNNWNRILINDNIIRHVHSNFIEANTNADVDVFSFKGNELHNIDKEALSFLSYVPKNVLLFDDNLFNQTCDCNMTSWLEGITNTTERTQLAMDTSYCIVNEFLSRCYSLPEGVINIQNFSDKTCTNFTKCEPYIGKTKVVFTPRKMFVDKEELDHQKWIVVIIAIVAGLLIIIVTTFIFLLLRGNRWLRDKCLFRNSHYNNDQFGNDEEGTVVTVAENEKLQFPDELTLEFLQVLSTRLDDPATHQEASEMIERLYEMFIVDDSYENNNREDEAHLYEELGNLNLQIPPPPYEEDKEQNSRSILKLMEEKINLNLEDPSLHNGMPSLVSDYSEPTDAAVHLYSEIKNKPHKDESPNCMNSLGSAKSFRSFTKFSEPGPSTKF